MIFPILTYDSEARGLYTGSVSRATNCKGPHTINATNVGSTKSIPRLQDLG